MRNAISKIGQDIWHIGKRFDLGGRCRRVSRSLRESLTSVMLESLAIPEAERRLRQLLDASAVSGSLVSPGGVLDVFQAFAGETVACTSDSVLFE
jgi:hypothetical protein